MLSANKPARYQFSWALMALLVVGAVLYWPGLQGGFVFDDSHNLEPLGYGGGVDSLDRALAFVFGNHSGPVGRPLSMASFLMDGQDWPTNAFAFKRTNLVLHLMCTAFMALLALRLLRIAGYREALAQGGALLCAALWMMHPLQVSAVLYVVQRMTILSSLCMLIGLLCYLRGRCGQARSDLRNILWMIAGFGVGIGVGVLAKENAILMAAYVLVIEWVFASRLPLRRVLALPARWMAALPLLAVTGYLAYRVSVVPTYTWRGWTLQDRLWTQPGVVLDYLQQILLPNVARMGLAHDDWVIARGLWEPATTAWSLLGVLALLVMAVWTRKRYPLLALALAWFFAGHLLESTVLPLEMYFEHRNYLAMAGIVLLVSVLCARAADALRERGCNRLRFMPVALPVMVLFVLSFGLTTLWGNTRLLQASWANSHPNSSRAQLALAAGLELAGDVDAAHAHMVRLFRMWPDRMDLGINALIMQCKYALPTTLTAEEILQNGRIESVSFGLHASVSALLKLRLRSACDAVSLDDVEQLMMRIGKDPLVQKNDLLMSRLYFDYAELKIKQRDFSEALRALEQAYRSKPSLDIALKLAVIWATGGQYEQSYRWLMMARLHDEARLMFVPSRAPELDKLERIIGSRLKASGVDVPAAVNLAEPPYVPDE